MFIYLNFFVVFIIVILINYKRKIKLYDERQRIFIGNAYRYGYASLVLSIFSLNFLSYRYQIDILAIPYLLFNVFNFSYIYLFNIS